MTGEIDETEKWENRNWYVFNLPCYPESVFFSFRNMFCGSFHHKVDFAFKYSGNRRGWILYFLIQNQL
jgi:hypothetical protein